LLEIIRGVIGTATPTRPDFLVIAAVKILFSNFHFPICMLAVQPASAYADERREKEESEEESEKEKKKNRKCKKLKVGESCKPACNSKKRLKNSFEVLDGIIGYCEHNGAVHLRARCFSLLGLLLLLDEWRPPFAKYTTRRAACNT
jgi:hypothetical protein